MALSEAQESNLASQRAAKQQDKKIPQVINIHDGRLMPNVKALRENPDYRPWQGPADADLRTRMQMLSTGMGAGSSVRVVASRPIVDAETFDVSTATKEEMISFAFDNYGLVLESSTHVATMRKQVLAAAERAAAHTAEDMA